MKLPILSLLLLIGVIESALFTMTDLRASTAYPCKATTGYPTICGPNGDAAPGSCFHVVGTTSCSWTTSVHCSETSDYWCHTDDECGTTTKAGSTCSTSNYATDTYLWYFDCPSRSGLPPSPCACVRDTDLDESKSITYKAFNAGGTDCP